MQRGCGMALTAPSLVKHVLVSDIITQVALWVKRRTSDQDVAGSTPTQALLVQQP